MDDRAIDKLIATKVMGYRTHSISAKVWYSEADRNSYPKDTFRPSASIAGAWLVVDKMRSMNKYVYVMAFVDQFYRCEIREYFVSRKGNSEKLLANEGSDTAPRAICLAALKALGVTHEK